MKAKILIATLIAIKCCTDAATTLRRTPRVYNALITTDDNLTSSRAYPVIQPSIHEPGIAHFPFGPYNPYGFYSPPVVRFGQPIAPGLLPREQFQRRHQSDVPNFTSGGFFLPTHNIPPHHQEPIEPEPSEPDQQPSQPQPAENEVESETPAESKATPNKTQTKENNESEAMPAEKLPIPLNEYGLPPSLIPLQAFGGKREHPVNLPPFEYNHYPIVYDPINGFREQYLPPYDYYPNHAFGYHPSHIAPKQKPIRNPGPAATPAATTPIENDQTSTALPSFESIRNGSENKNSDVPDVPPPPIPFGNKQSRA